MLLQTCDMELMYGIKPAPDAQRMLDTAEKTGKLLQIGFVCRYGRDCRIIEDFRDNGYFGDFYFAKALYLRRNGSPGGWFANKKYSGGGLNGGGTYLHGGGDPDFGVQSVRLSCCKNDWAGQFCYRFQSPLSDLFEYNIVKISRRKSGSFAYDFTALERYLKICAKYDMIREVYLFGLIRNRTDTATELIKQKCADGELVVSRALARIFKQPDVTKWNFYKGDDEQFSYNPADYDLLRQEMITALTDKKGENSQ